MGAEITGIDLSRAVPSELRALAANALRDHHLVLVRGQEVDLQGHLRFAECFGSIDQSGYEAAPEVSEEMYISNTRPEGVAREGPLLKHQDHCFYPRLLPVLSLYAETVAGEGGETIFANAHRAYENLPAELRSRVAKLHARHVYDYANDYGTRRFRIEESPDAPNASHPVVLENVRNGRPLLFVNELMTDSIVELPAKEGEALLQQLLAYLEDPTVIYLHRWQPGDLMVWDNLSLQHGRRPFPEGAPRSLRRLQIR